VGEADGIDAEGAPAAALPMGPWVAQPAIATSKTAIAIDFIRYPPNCKYIRQPAVAAQIGRRVLYR
jgi:hypothetical protein